MKERKILEIGVRVFGLFQASLTRVHEREDGCVEDSDVIEGEFKEVSVEDREIANQPSPELVKGAEQSKHRK